MQHRADAIEYMERVVTGAPEWPIAQIQAQVGSWNRVYLVFVDVLKGFCEVGPLASPRVREMVKPVAELAQILEAQGLPAENIIFINDDHPVDAVEFAAFAPHCVHGTPEAEVMDELKPFAEKPGVQVYRKNATNGLFGVNEAGVRFCDWLQRAFAEGPSCFIVVGDCTDLCIYQNAMGIRLLANQLNAKTQVIVPVSHVRTYDLPVEKAEQIGALAHHADLLDTVFLYHMQLNGIQLVSRFTD
ncbi:cysteine hydrolase family protein [Laceyella putida]|uniref:Cysteine hydrolase family protein n=1 Tax=Laceyella putida TaxID=110101 RepID=A0ABW2RHU1_9BACL